jgi:hypothetical protein
MMPFKKEQDVSEMLTLERAESVNIRILGNIRPNTINGKSRQNWKIAVGLLHCKIILGSG